MIGDILAIAAIVIGISGAIYGVRQLLAELREPDPRDAIIAAANLHIAALKRETEPGFDLGLQDECELILAATNADEAAAARAEARFYDAIRDQITKGDTQ
ncbi:hypothetical protein ACFVFJ_44600 [Streptomyces sp. NPDC057717]|uniref:hypothetical protein n=1 Tax=Streptomyces sp. NPDC057717 TaxID=3346224 RepID=UPI0036A57901